MFGVGNVIAAGINAYVNKRADERAEGREMRARADAYRWNEAAADAADARSRALYEDYESPAAMLRQIREAGMSPSLMFSGAGAGGGAVPSGAQGGGTAGGNASVLGGAAMTAGGMSGNDLANLALMKAQIDNIKADTRSKDAGTEHQKIVNEWDATRNNVYQAEANLMGTYIDGLDGNVSSIDDIATSSSDYEDFINRLRKSNWENNEQGRKYIDTEYGQQILRGIYNANHKLSAQIAEFDESTTSSYFEKSLLDALSAKGFAEWNAQEQVQHLRKNVATDTLDESQKNAYNTILDTVEKEHGTGAKTALIVGMEILDRLTGKVNLNVDRKKVGVKQSGEVTHTHKHTLEK